MKRVEINQFTHGEVSAPAEPFGYLKIPGEHKIIRAEGEEMIVSDGYHTFDELYEHRIALFIALCSIAMRLDGDLYVWKSRKHADGTAYEGWFIGGIDVEKGKQISYHVPNKYWDEIVADERENAPEWDGHTSADVLERLKKI